MSVNIQKRKMRRLVCRPNCRGVASTEAMVALPTLILLLCGVLYVSRSITARHQAEDHARSCAWRYSASGCSSVPNDCIGIVRSISNDVNVVGTVTSQGERITKNYSSAYSDMSGQVQTIAKKIIETAFESVVMNALIDDARGQVDYGVPRPGISEDSDYLSATYQIPCNLKETTVTEVAKSAGDKLVKSIFK